MKRREFITLLGGAAAMPLAAHAQERERVRRIGVLIGSSEDDPDTKARLARFRQEIERFGWLEGHNIRIDHRFAPAGAQAQTLARELLALQPDVLISQGTPATTALRQASNDIPIVFVGVADPVGSGFAVSLARPGRNLTGLSLFEPSVVGKWLAMLKEMAPRLTTAALMLNPKTAPYYHTYLGAAERAASSLAIELVFRPLENDAASIEQSIDSLSRLPNSGLVLPPDTTTTLNRNFIIAAAARYRLPAVYSNRLFVVDGGLMAYSTDRFDQYRHAASYVDRILRGAKPADLPVQAPTKYETVINLKTAKALGLTVPPGLLVAADEVIE